MKKAAKSAAGVVFLCWLFGWPVAYALGLPWRVRNVVTIGFWYMVAPLTLVLIAFGFIIVGTFVMCVLDWAFGDLAPSRRHQWTLKNIEQLEKELKIK